MENRTIYNPPTPKTIYDIAAPLVIKWEGFSQYPYYCPAGVLTIGCGDVIDDDDIFSYQGRTISGAKLKKSCAYIKERYSYKTRTQLNNILKNRIGAWTTTQDAYRKTELMLRDDYWRQIRKSLPHGLTDNQCAAILSLVYNIGVDAFRKSTLLRRLNQGRIAEAANEFLRWVYSDRRILRGLIRRRKEERAIFCTPDAK